MPVGRHERANKALMASSVECRLPFLHPELVEHALALEGVLLVPVTARWNEDLLERAGFKAVDCFWRSLNYFAGWVAVKGERS